MISVYQKITSIQRWVNDKSAPSPHALSSPKNHGRAPKLLIQCIVFTLFFCAPNEAKAQSDSLIQVTGQLTNEWDTPLPYAHVLILNSYRGAITDTEGKYSIVAEKGDSLMYSSVGYKNKVHHIHDTVEQIYLYLDYVLEQDTLFINEVQIYPWKSYEEFKKAFLALEIPDDDLERARKNIAIIKTQIILDHTPSARQNYREVLNEQYRKTFNKNMYPSYQITNPFAWAKFFEALKRGDFNKE